MSKGIHLYLDTCTKHLHPCMAIQQFTQHSLPSPAALTTLLPHCCLSFSVQPVWSPGAGHQLGHQEVCTEQLWRQIPSVCQGELFPCCPNWGVKPQTVRKMSGNLCRPVCHQISHCSVKCGPSEWLLGWHRLM